MTYRPVTTPGTDLGQPSSRRPLGSQRAVSRSLRRGFQSVFMLGATAAIAAGCGAASPKAAAPTSTSAASAGGAAAPGGAAVTTAPAGAVVTAKLTEFEIAVSRTSLTPGSYTFDAVNAGHTDHGLTIDGPGVSDMTTGGSIKPGQTAKLTVALKAGTYKLYCPVADHKMLGMNVSLTVAGSAPSSAGGSSASGGSSGGAPAPATTSGSGGASSGGGSYGY
ncbi:MAG: hypothetical protein M3137_04945 [Actinomycetota bacterium]|nr:hypothetical protein [Actinomycetota bacterium]